MIVVDASALIEVLLRTPGAAAIRARMLRAGESVHAPYLIDVEVTQVLRRLALHGKIDDARGREALSDHGKIRIRRYPHFWLTSTAWRLRANVSAYDAMYVALALSLRAPLLTHDGKLASAVGALVPVELV